MTIKEQSIINKSSNYLFDRLSTNDSFINIMPDSVQEYVPNEEGFTFTLKGLPSISIIVKERIEKSKISLVSSPKSKVEFSIDFLFDEIESEKAQITIVFKAEGINTMMKMMLERPLKNLIKTFIDKISTL